MGHEHAAGTALVAVASFATCAVLWRRHGVRVLPGAAVLFAAAFALLTATSTRPAEAAL